MSSYDAVVQAEAGTFHKFITHPEATANDTFGDGGDWGPPLAPNHGLPGGEGSRSSARGPIGVRVEESFRNFASSLKQVQVKDVWSWLTYTITLSPAVMLALILNLLDAMSYGIIIFPSGDENIPDTAQQAGISMFLASTVISQLVYTLGGSAFKGAVGSMMIEVMPFLHIICRTVEAEMQGADSSSILATVMVAYAMSTLLTGLVFLLLGIFKMGNLIQFFPRHILVGCIGGIGLFLVLTGVEVTTSIPNEYSIGWLKEIFAPSALKLWGSSLALAVLLKLMQRRIHHPLFVPLFYVGVPIIFYIIVFAAKIPMEELRRAGWLFAVPEGKAAPFYEFWTYYDFAKVQWSALPATIPTQLALTFFGILHVPINVPALAVSTQQDVDLNKELIGHGMSNLASGFMGSTQNYLVYSNSILYIRSGGNSVTGGLLLTLGTAAVWVAGGKVVTFVPTIIVGSLIFHLGIDLLKESMVDTWSTGIHNLEYLTILLIIFIMGVVGFTEGITAGLILACIFFVVMYARKSVIRAIYTGSQLRSTVHRLYRQQCFLDQVGDQIHIIKLQGFMFFGTINQLDQYVGQVLKDNPRIRYVVMDFSLIYGIDYSALESFHRIKRMLGETNTHLVFAGLTMVGSTLMRSGIFDIEEDDETHNVHNFETVNEALEWCENQLLVTYYAKQASREGSTLELSIPKAIVEPSLRKSDTLLGISFTPREKEIQQAASLILNDEPPLRRPESNEFLPVAILLQAFAETTDLDDEMLEFFGNRFERTEAAKDTVLWLSGEEARELYVVEEGELVLLIHEQDHTTQSRIKVVETLLPGTMVGELEMFSDRPRACRLIAQTDSVIWRLSKTSFDQMALENPGLMLKFVTKIALSFDAVRFYNTVYHWGQLK
ncbi:sulfate transporter family-domain-containing protein [Phlyctochytrium arcticum]|nr:sulfate transporter family-domain-containing protein [Phlyctochytrium arcticum]